MEHETKISKLSDEELLLYSQKKPSTFELLVARYQKQFLSRALAVIGNKDDAEDIVQDTFVRIYRFGPRFKGERGTFKAWAMTILMNVARTRYQRRSKEWSHTAPLNQEHYETLPDERNRAEAIEAKDIIERALTYLSEETENILRLAFLEGLPHKEISERMSISVGAVKIRVHRAKKELRKTIGDIAL